VGRGACVFPGMSRFFQVLSRSAAFISRFVTVAIRFVPFCHGSHGKLGWLVAVSSRRVTASDDLGAGAIRHPAFCYGLILFPISRQTAPEASSDSSEMS